MAPYYLLILYAAILYLSRFSKQHKELACIMLREFRSHPEVASQFHELREEHVLVT
jgi:hypothetical protein